MLVDITLHHWQPMSSRASCSERESLKQQALLTWFNFNMMAVMPDGNGFSSLRKEAYDKIN
jgi:hypothetical protein